MFRLRVHFSKDKKENRVKKAIEVLEPQPIKGRKASKLYNKLNAKTELNGNLFQVDPDSINYMSAVVSIANFRFIEMLSYLIKENQSKPVDKRASIEELLSKAEQQVYDMEIDWKTADNKFVKIKLRDIPNALENAMKLYKKIISEY